MFYVVQLKNLEKLTFLAIKMQIYPESCSYKPTFVNSQGGLVFYCYDFPFLSHTQTSYQSCEENTVLFQTVQRCLN